MATFLLILEETTNPRVAASCIDGFAHAIKICGYFDMASERSHFVQSFVRFAFISDQKEIKDKNVQVIHKILELATQHGNFLGDSWQYVLQEVSRLEEMINLGKGQRDSDFFDPNSQPQPRQREQVPQPDELPMDLKSVRERTYQ
jgi:brefeldin A-inhibited guanine nucleotide-exchange protein